MMVRTAGFCALITAPWPERVSQLSLPLQADDLPDLTAAYPILVSDDDDVLVIMVQRLLEHGGHLTTMGTICPYDTIRLSEDRPVSLIISDIMKPYMNGLDMLKAVRANPRTRHVPFMFVSACCNPRVREEAKALGVDRYLVKPVFPQALLREVRLVLMRRYRKVMMN